MGVGCDIELVGDEDDGVTLLLEPIEDAHDFPAGLGIQVARRLVGQQD